ncbi:MAG: insulinase family protein [Kofleriaceae bacterium]
MHSVRVLVALGLIACGSPQPQPQPQPQPRPIAGEPAKPTPDGPTPLDPQIRKGTLANGLTYYIMKHGKPEQRATLWLAVNAGSVLEDDDQRGLAHFVEHMAFNGTKRFKKQAIVEYIEKVGMQFGADVNAYTSFDETVYQLTVPTDDTTVMLTGLDILRDWAADVTFDPVEVDKERGVVLEEWRLGRGAFARIDDKQNPIIFQGSRYAERLTIGLPEILKKAPRDTLVRYYQEWYRPQNMAVIAVGDFDDEAMLKEITQRFGTLTSTGAARTREPVPVPRDHPTAVTIATDPEMPFTQVTVYDKLAHKPERTRADYRIFLVENLYHRMMNTRFEELALEATSPFVSAGSSSSDLSRTTGAFIRSAQAKQGRVGEALGALFREIARVERHGFLQSEVDRARTDMITSAETSAAEWEKTPSDSIADEMTRNFFEDEQMPGRPVELTFHRELLPTVTLAELDHLAQTWGGAQGRVIAISGPASTKLPTEAEVRDLVGKATAADVPAWVETKVLPLLATPPAPGKIVSTTKDDATGTTTWKLANGVRVVVKPTTFQNATIELQGYQLGGSSLIANVVDARFADDIVARGGVGELDAIALRKTLAGKVADVNVWFNELSESAYAQTRPADLETAMQLLHLRLTAPRRDERAYAAWKAEQIEYARNRRLSPERSFFEDMSAVQYGNHPRYQPVSVELIGKTDLDRALAAWKLRMRDLGNFTFVVVGNVDLAKLAPLVETYLGSLPSSGRKDTWKNIGVTYPTGKVAKTILAGSEPKSFFSLAFGGPDTWSRTAARDVQVLAMVLQMRLREVLREDLGGVYGTRVSGSVSRQPTQRRTFSIGWGCDPANVDKLRDAALAVIHAIQKDGISADYLAKVSEQLRRSRETDMKENWWWLSQLQTMLWFGDDFKDLADLDATLARVTSDHIKAAAKHFLDERNTVTGVLRPKP